MSDHNKLSELADLYGVQRAYFDAFGHHRCASDEALLQILRALGAPVDRREDAEAAMRQRRLALWRRVVEPVAVAWDGNAAPDPVQYACQKNFILLITDGGSSGDLFDDQDARVNTAFLPPSDIETGTDQGYADFFALIGDQHRTGSHVSINVPQRRDEQSDRGVSPDGRQGAHRPPAAIRPRIYQNVAQCWNCLVPHLAQSDGRFLGLRVVARVHSL